MEKNIWHTVFKIIGSHPDQIILFHLWIKSANLFTVAWFDLPFSPKKSAIRLQFG